MSADLRKTLLTWGLGLLTAVILSVSGFIGRAWAARLEGLEERVAVLEAARHEQELAVLRAQGETQAQLAVIQAELGRALKLLGP